MSRFTIDLPENKKGNVWRLDMVNIQHIDYINFKPKMSAVQLEQLKRQQDILDEDLHRKRIKTSQASQE